MGIDTGKSGQQCVDGLGLGRPYDTAFSECCNEVVSTSPSPSTSTITTTASLTSIQSDTTEPQNKNREHNTSDPRKYKIAFQKYINFLPKPSTSIKGNKY